ncbi:amidohydrolase family protein [Acuticoccus mangrovi]|uniref:Amidohydrolase family protein n=1 Tax=Acuticoccus mangrovi TaxID=2796142 RepID=A0A934IJ05_9HYPH|nr:amidohydrolase family protein [Acuticoccus mangrovi]MBJ3774617.1 amidohydrolase family protein [Acuticoccus mangrovi]
MPDLVIKNASVPAWGDQLVDIAIEGETIAGVAPSIQADCPVHDAEGLLVAAGLVETHIHLDKSRIIDRCEPETKRLPEAVRRVSDVKHTFTVEDVVARADETVRNAVANGTTRMRTHVEVDPKVGMRGFEGVQEVAKRWKWAIDIEICVFPQEGLTNSPGTDELMVEGLKRGATAVGAAPGYDTDHAGQIRRVFELAREFDVDIDMHLDFGNTPDDLDAILTCELAKEHGYEGRVAIGHATKLSTLSVDKQKEVALRLADAGVAVTVLPATDLFLMGRDQDHNVRRGLVDANMFAEHGCNCSLSTNNILNPFTPYGDCSLIRMANLHANVLQVSHKERLADCFAMLTDRSAKLLNLKDYGIAAGNPADLVIIDAASPADAVARIAQPLAVFKRGRRTVTRTRPELHPPH